MNSTHRAKILAAYKELLLLIRRLPNDRKLQALDEARQTMRLHASENDLGKQSELFKQLAARISFLRTVTPRQPGDVSNIGAGHFVLREGKLVQGAGTSAGTRVADGSMSMSEAYERHHQLLKRQNFGRTPPKYDPSSF